MAAGKSRRTTGIWLLVILLAIFVLLSFLLLGIILRDLTAGEYNIISLTPDKAPEGFFTSVIYRPAQDAPELYASDQQARWEVITEVDLFKTAYLDPEGMNITVQSEDGAKVIAPGTTNEYTFSLKNTGNISLDYTLSMEGIFTLTNENLPFQVRMKKGNDWVVGNEEEWTTVDELNEVVDSGTLPVGNYIPYSLEWQWPYETDQDDMLIFGDVQDSAIGNAAVTEANVNFQLTIQTISQVTPGAVPMDADGNLLYEELVSPGRLALTAGSMGIVGLLLILLLLVRNRIYVTGFVPGMAGSTMVWKKKKDTIRVGGRFVFESVPLAKHTFAVQTPGGAVLAQMQWKLKRDRKSEGIRFETDEGLPTVVVGKGIIALELHLLSAGPMLELQRLQWAAIDKNHNVYTPLGRKAPDAQGCNRTPDGLMIDEKGKLLVADGIRVS